MENKSKQELKIEKRKRKEFLKNKMQLIVWILAVGATVYGIFWIVTLPRIPQTEVISRNGIHTHSTLSITIDGESVEIPAGVGISAVNHSPMHTHEPDGVIHMEYSGVVYNKDLKVKKFFDIWGKDFTEDSFMGNQIGEGSTVEMTVNGEKNSELESYSMKDGDIIEIVYN